MKKIQNLNAVCGGKGIGNIFKGLFYCLLYPLAALSDGIGEMLGKEDNQSDDLRYRIEDAWGL